VVGEGHQAVPLAAYALMGPVPGASPNVFHDDGIGTVYFKFVYEVDVIIRYSLGGLGGGYPGLCAGIIELVYLTVIPLRRCGPPLHRRFAKDHRLPAGYTLAEPQVVGEGVIG